MIKAILFDLDGVLIDAVKIHEAAFLAAVKVYGGCELDSQFHHRELNGLPTLKKLQKLSTLGLIHPDNIDLISDKKQEQTIEIIKQRIQADSEKREMLQALKDKGYELACVTNSIRKTAHLMLTSADLYDLLDYVVSNQDIDNPKPHPEPYWKAISHFKLLPEECLVVEDSEVGLQCAKYTGCCIWKVNGPEDVHLENATKILDELVRLHHD
jgi:HAD superfamily hydrolase (TIGR01509 family)